MNDPISRYARTKSDELALISADDTWTYSQFDDHIRRFHGALANRGVQVGTRVGLHLPTSARAVFWLWATWRAGAVAVPISTRLPPAEVVTQARQADVPLLITEEDRVHEESPDDLRVRSPGDFHSGNHVVKESGSLPCDRSATVLFTSGSTGHPKAALHSWSNHLYSAKGANANIPLRSGDRWLLSLPLYHVGGLAVLVRCGIAGTAVVVPGERGLAKELRTQQITHVSVVPTQLRRLLEVCEVPLRSVRTVLLGGGPLPDDLVDRAYGAGWPLHTTYGCTEMASQITTTAPGVPRRALRTAGRRLPHRRIRIVDGEIHVRGRPLFRGYVEGSELEDPRTADGWYPTGDRGKMDASGRLRVIGRKDRMFVSGGENIQPEELEQTLLQIPGVDHAVVVPVEDPEYGHRPVAFVGGNDCPSAADLERIMRERLPGFKIPDAFHSLTESMGEGHRTIDRAYLKGRARELREE